MTYQILKSNLAKLESRINRIIKKGGNIVFNILGDCTIVHPENNNIVFSGVEVDVSGTYKLNGWCFVGVLEHADNGNIIRLVDSSFEGKVPERYKTAPVECEHCHKQIRRKDTYLVYNENTNEFKQVGSTCLLDYTGLSAEKCAQLAAILPALDEYGEIKEKDIDFSLTNSFAAGFSNDYATKAIYNYVLEKGYSKEQLRTLIEFLYTGTKNLASQEKIEEMDAWVNTLNTNNSQYLYNASIAWTKSCIEPRDVTLIASFVSVFLKEKTQRATLANDKSNVYVGEIGDRISIKVKAARVLYYRDNSWKSYYADSSCVWEIIDTEGHTFIWSTSHNKISEGDIIKATIKDHKEYKGKKQTTLTRGSIQYSASETAFQQADEIND